MMTQAWNISAYNFETAETKILLSSEDHPTTPAMFIHFDVENGPVYATIVESPAQVGAERSSVLKIDLESGEVEEIYAFESDQVRIGRLSVNGEVLVAEQVASAKDADPSQPAIMIRFEPDNALQEINLAGWNPLLTDKHLVLANGNPNQFPTSVTVSDISGEDPSQLKLLGENIIIQYLNGDYLSWQASGGPEAATTGIYMANLETRETYNIASPDDNTALILPIIIRNKIHFGMVTDFMSLKKKALSAPCR